MGTDEELLKGIEDGSYRSWDESKIQAVTDSYRIDPLRKLVEQQGTHRWLESVKALLSSENADHVLIGHCIGRPVIRAHPEAAQAAKNAFERWKDHGVLHHSLLHDLMEDEQWLLEHREEIAHFIREHSDDVKKILLETYFQRDEQRFLDYTVGRLDDVWSDCPRTMNKQGKAFVYVLYLGLVSEPGLRARARSCIQRHSNKGDPFYRKVTADTLEVLARPV